MSPAPELKATLTLPQTTFPMKANLPQNEPLRLARWASLQLYQELRKAGQGRPVYLLHDGPPYANGPIHLGHALNKGLKDFVVKSKTMAGFDSPFVPGYDCHGLPIEIKVDEKLGHKKLEMPVPAVLDACRAYAQKYVDLQTQQFERIGCFGRWDRPYKTMARSYEARTLEAFYGFLEKGFVYRGLKPVYWCIHDRTALAEAEVEYADHTSPSIYVRYRLTSDPAAIDPALAGRDVSTIIWTTTPWTLPASLAVAFHPDFDYVALEVGAPPDQPQTSGAPGLDSETGEGTSSPITPVILSDPSAERGEAEGESKDLHFNAEARVGNQAPVNADQPQTLGAPSLSRLSEGNAGTRVGDPNAQPIYIVAAGAPSLPQARVGNQAPISADQPQTLGAPSLSRLSEGNAGTRAGDPNAQPIYIVAAELAAQVVAACQLGSVKEIARFKGAALDRVTFQHPFLERSILGVLATYVTADTGTGAVHTAPSHGADDFYTGQKYGLDPTTRVDAAGHIHVDPAAWHLANPPAFDGLNVWKANPVILAMLEERGALLGGSQFQHSYPHCWRCHHPIIYRATEQWFISLETPMKRADGSEVSYRQLAIEEIDKVIWDPAWGKERITNMIATRPDWCISRQRIWGVPIAVFMCEGCNQPIVDAELNRLIVNLFDSEGIEAWHSSAASALLSDELKLRHAAGCPHGVTSFRKETDILDVWFDSGVSWFAVCETDPDLSPAYKSFESGATFGTQTEISGASHAAGSERIERVAPIQLPEGAMENSPGQPRAVRGGSPGNALPMQLPEGAIENSPGQAERSPGNAAKEISQSPVGAIETKRTEVLYLEGGDQHRGWFHSSLLTSVALRGHAPYSHVATAGWTLDEQGRAMSKSLGNGVDPVDIANRMGGEIVRLWVASVDFREDMAASENLMQRCAELYKKLRNTFRFLLGNLNGFDPARDRIAESDLTPLDRYMLARTRDLTEKILAWYEAFEFHRIYHAVNEFAIVDLSAFYLDVLKDRMYTFAPTNPARRSAQTVLWKITETLVRLVAPILSFTADEIWEHLPTVEGREPSVHLAHFPKPDEIFPDNPVYLIENWKLLFAIRGSVLSALEELRQTKVIGKSLEADVELYAEGTTYENLRESGTRLEELFNVSQVHVIKDFQKVQSSARVPSPREIGFANIADLRGFVMPASGHKCARCWNFMPHVSNYGIWENVCDRCQSALREMNIAPPKPEAAE